MIQLKQLNRDLTNRLHWGFVNWWMGMITKLEALQNVVLQIKVDGSNPIRSQDVRCRWPANTIHLCLPMGSGKVVTSLTLTPLDDFQRWSAFYALRLFATTNIMFRPTLTSTSEALVPLHSKYSNPNSGQIRLLISAAKILIMNAINTVINTSKKGRVLFGCSFPWLCGADGWGTGRLIISEGKEQRKRRWKER